MLVSEGKKHMQSVRDTHNFMHKKHLSNETNGTACSQGFLTITCEPSKKHSVSSAYSFKIWLVKGKTFYETDGTACSQDFGRYNTIFKDRIKNHLPVKLLSPCVDEDPVYMERRK